MEGDRSPLDTCFILPLEEVLSELQAVLTLFRCYSAINAADIVVVGISMWRWWKLPWESSLLHFSPHISYCCFLQLMLPSPRWDSPCPLWENHNRGTFSSYLKPSSNSPPLLGSIRFPRPRHLLGLHAPRTWSNKGATLKSPPPHKYH